MPHLIAASFDIEPEIVGDVNKRVALIAIRTSDNSIQAVKILLRKDAYTQLPVLAQSYPPQFFRLIVASISPSFEVLFLGDSNDMPRGVFPIPQSGSA